MVQPIQYQIPGVSSPFENLVSGLKLGATMGDMDAARVQQQAAIDQKALADTAFSAYLAKPTDQRTQDDTRQLIRFLPAAQVQNLLAIDAALSDKQRENQALFAGEVCSALKSKKPEIAMNRVRERLNAETDPQKKQGLKLLLDSIEQAPDFALETLRMSTLALGDKYEKAANAMFGAPTVGGKTISSPADKIAFGITDAEGKPLTGTFFVESGKEPKLVKGEEGQKPTPPSTVMQLYGEIADLVKGGASENDPRILSLRSKITKESTFAPTAPGTVVNIPGQPRIATKLEEEMDKRFAPLAVDWLSGDKTKAASRINQLNAVVNILETQKRITGPVLGLTPDVVQSFVTQTSVEARANAERVIQEGLRATIGAQFTRAEGEAFLARSYDQKAPQADNARRLKAIVTQMQESAKDREAMLKYVQGPGDGSLRGYKGRIPSIQDFYDAIEEKAPPSATPPSAPVVTNPAKAAAVDAALKKYKSK